MEMNESIEINLLVLRKNIISHSIDYIDDVKKCYRNFKYENIKSNNNILLVKNSLSISSGDYLEFYIDSKKLKKYINSKYTKFELECDIWSKNDNNILIDKHYPRFFYNYRDYKIYLKHCGWEYERIIITENHKDVKSFLFDTGTKNCTCGSVENNVVSVMCPKNKIISFRCSHDKESYYNGEEIHDAHHFNLKLMSK